MDTYTAHAKRWAHGWELHIDGVGVTQSRTLADAQAMARDYIATDRDVAPNTFRVAIVPEIGGEIDGEIERARAEQEEAVRRTLEAASRYRRVVRKLSDTGLSGQDIARVLGISTGRVSQLLSDTAPSMNEVQLAAMTAGGRRRVSPPASRQAS